MSAATSLAITGWSIRSALGDGPRATVAALREGRSGLGEPPAWLPLTTRCGVVGGELPAPPASHRTYDCHQARLALAAYDGVAGAIAAAIRRWGAARVAVVVGTSTGGIERTERALEHLRAVGRLPDDYDPRRQHDFDAFARLLAHVAGARGPSYVVSTACSSSAKVFAAARRLIAADLCDAALVGGVDSLCRTTLFGFRALDILAPEACRPFGEGRRGISIGEGAALLVVERAGDAPVRLLGIGESADAHSMTSPHPEGLGAALAMRRALAAAGLPPEAVDHVNAHGTGTVHNDASEARAIALIFGAATGDVAVASTKGFTGHTLGAAGAIEAVLGCLAIEHGFVPPSLGAAPVGADIPLAPVAAARARRCRVVMSNSFGFGGSNASLVLGAAA